LGLGDDIKCAIRSRLEFALVNFNAALKCYIAVGYTTRISIAQFLSAVDHFGFLWSA
jgi:hypothetical protein